MYMWTTNHAIPTDVNAFLAAYIYIIYHNVYIFYACVFVGSIQESLLLLHRWLQYSSGRTGVCEITSSHFYIIYVYGCARASKCIYSFAARYYAISIARARVGFARDCESNVLRRIRIKNKNIARQKRLIANTRVFNRKLCIRLETFKRAVAVTCQNVYFEMLRNACGLVYR